jgi:hypothetical protein
VNTDLPAGARRDLLRVLESPSNVRADVIRQFNARGDKGMVEVLSELEANDLLRLQVIEELRCHAQGEPCLKLNRWWSDDPAEVFWMEITERDNLGDDLNAPQLADNGREFWGYSLIGEINDGDVVFHYHKDDHAIIAWSRASGGVWDDTVLWGARGTTARTAGVAPYLRPGWRHGLEDFSPIEPSVTLDDLRGREADLRAI